MLIYVNTGGKLRYRLYKALLNEVDVKVANWNKNNWC